MAIARTATVALVGIEAAPVDVQVSIAGGMPGFTIVGLADKAVAESRERVRAAFSAIGLALPPRRITVNLAPADLPKEGSHYDLPIAVGLLAAMEVVSAERIAELVVLGELGLDGGVAPVAGVLPAAVAALESGRGLVCPAACGAEAAWVEGLQIAAVSDLLTLIGWLKGSQELSRPAPRLAEEAPDPVDLADVRGQETAKRVLEIAASGGHNMLMIGPPGAGKSMLAQRLPGLLPPMSPTEALEVSLIMSVSGLLEGGRVSRARPFRAPHHSASMPAMVGGGRIARPGEISLAHHGVLFLDELPEFPRMVLESLRQPLETGESVVARVHSHVKFPARTQLVSAMNPCKCGWLSDAGRACSRAPRCAEDYQARVSGPFLDRIDLVIEVPAARPGDLQGPRGEPSADVRARVAAARAIQAERYAILAPDRDVRLNAHAAGPLLDEGVRLAPPARDLLMAAAERLRLSARSFHRIMRVARTIADLDGAPQTVGRIHLAEALSYRADVAN